MSLYQPYTTIADVQNELKNTTDAARAKIESAINAASRAIEDFCNRDFLFHDYSEDGYLVPLGDIILKTIYLPWPVITLTSIEYDGTALEAEDYKVAGRTRILTMDDYTPPEGDIDTKVTLYGTFGYALDEDDPTGVPPPSLDHHIRRACTLIAAAWSGEMRKQQVGLDGTKVELIDNRIPQEAKLLLNRFKRHVL